MNREGCQVLSNRKELLTPLAEALKYFGSIRPYDAKAHTAFYTFYAIWAVLTGEGQLPITNEFNLVVKKWTP